VIRFLVIRHCLTIYWNYGSAIYPQTGKIETAPAGLADTIGGIKMDLSIITYDSGSAQMKHLSYVDELMQYKDNSKISWINICGLDDVDAIKHFCELFSIHQLSIEDILSPNQQPKAEIFDKYEFLSIKTIEQKKTLYNEQKNRRRKKQRSWEMSEILINQISMIIMKNIIITFQNTDGNSFNDARRRILDNVGEFRKMGPDYLAYSIIDTIVDEYFITLNSLEDNIEDYEDRATKTSDDTFIQEIQDIKKCLLRIKHAILPLEDNLLIISRHERAFQTDVLKPFLQDLREHLAHAVTMVENQHEWLVSIMDVNLSVLSRQTNMVMKVLAMISTIFIPLTFIAGIYGMNFDFMPELRHELGYPVVLSIMGGIAMIMVIVFKKHRWF
jgi:magnesium transporter